MPAPDYCVIATAELDELLQALDGLDRGVARAQVAAAIAALLFAGVAHDRLADLALQAVEQTYGTASSPFRARVSEMRVDDDAPVGRPH